MTQSPLDAAGHGQNPSSAAEKADQLYNDYLAGGPAAAYESLKNDYDNSVGMKNRDGYYSQVANELNNAGHLSNIAISWLRENKENLDTNRDGAVDRREMQDAASGGGLDAIFGKVILTKVPSPDDDKTFFDQIAHTKRAWNVNPDAIEDADLRKYGRKEHRAERKDYNEEETIKQAYPLLANRGELLAVLDTGKHGERNNYISPREMKNFLDDYKQHRGEGVYTPENAEYVNELLHGQVGRVQQIPGHGFSIKGLLHRAGLTQEDVDSGRLDDRQDTQSDRGSKAPTAETSERGQRQADSSEERRTPPELNPERMELALRKHVDTLARIQPGEGYNAVAARLLNIFPGHPRTPQEMQDIKTLGRQIQKLNGEHSTYKLQTGVILPVSSNFELLMAENPAFKKAMEANRETYTNNVNRHYSRPQAAEAPADSGDDY